MGKYLDLVRDSRTPVSEVTDTELQGSGETARRGGQFLPEPKHSEARRLLDAGWKPKVSFGGETIWQRPDTGFYRSEEAAVCLLSRVEDASKVRLRKRGKREAVTQRGIVR